MNRLYAGGGWRAILYVIKAARRTGGFRRMWKALRARNACKTCALGMGGQLGGMVNEARRFPEVCKKSVQAMAADLQGAVNEHFFSDFSIEQMRGISSRDLEHAGRLVDPLYAGPLDSHYRRITWAEAIEKIVAKLQKTPPDESFFYFSGRSSNEAAFLMQLFARFYGTNNVNNCSYYCHQASGVGLTSVIGSGAGTVTLEDVEHADLLFVIGANPASNHPRLMRTIVELRRRGGKVIIVNPLRETGLTRFKVPSDVRSMFSLRGSVIADEYIQPHIGGDIALFTGLAKAVIERGQHDERFVREFCDDWEAFRYSIAIASWDEIVRKCGITRNTIRRLAEMYASSKQTIFCWAMGVTHHAHGVGNVKMIANTAMLRGMLGRPGAGLLPLRGHSNVQGVGSMGVVPQLKPEIAQRMERAFGITLPATAGLDTLAALEKARNGGIRFASCMGGNLYGASPDANFAAGALAEIDFVVYFNTTLNTGHAWGRGRETLLLPVLARDEEPQATTQESMFSYVRMSEGGEARHEGPRSEVEVAAEIAERYCAQRGGGSLDWAALRDHATIRRKIAEVIPGYEPIGSMDATKQEFHIPGRRFTKPRFATDTGRAKFSLVEMPPLIGDDAVATGGERAAPPLNGNDSALGHAPDSHGHLLRLMTIRSEGQFNTVVYEEEDIYRGQERRDVILMHREDMRRLGLRNHDRVRVRSEAGSLSNVIVREFDIAPGNAAMYFPEANALVPRTVDPQSRTPAYKSFAVCVEGQNNDGESQLPAITSSGAAPVAQGKPRKLNAC